MSTDDAIKRDLYINRNNHQKPTFHPLGDFLNPALALLGQGLKKSPIGQKLDFANHPYLCKGLKKQNNFSSGLNWLRSKVFSLI
ncbi:hypothetical protein [uncultured Gammaproteobacteria bacterium]|nr:hypothetical protein [uncultured Gammaproteobacteria bacterium]VVH58381.1 hypothetical protein BSPCLSOX_2534 [uncultured Gammaproteobacteria bacterium]VVH61714.1 hypothetical protein BSPWISOX_1091 [uncultured Gammaproteobacteria bacterium]VVM24473.1 hypothetical protein BSPWISOXPB_8005 [uncultured Gammaproteobacteria bacterium]VVM26328.1 hypothetical protein BSPWISOXPB_3772 [uncultured Gammaproteobacteria bacterium]